MGVDPIYFSSVAKDTDSCTLLCYYTSHAHWLGKSIIHNRELVWGCRCIP
jgi:hypothetical protein